MAAYTAWVSATSSTAPSAAFPGYGDPEAYATRVTSPPSSSMAMTGSTGAAARRAAVSATVSPVTFAPKKVTPASPRSSARSSHRGAVVPGNGGMRIASARAASAGSMDGS